MRNAVYMCSFVIFVMRHHYICSCMESLGGESKADEWFWGWWGKRIREGKLFVNVCSCICILCWSLTCQICPSFLLPSSLPVPFHVVCGGWLCKSPLLPTSQGDLLCISDPPDTVNAVAHSNRGCFYRYIARFSWIWIPHSPRQFFSVYSGVLY